MIAKVDVRLNYHVHVINDIGAVSMDGPDVGIEVSVERIVYH